MKQRRWIVGAVVATAGIVLFGLLAAAGLKTLGGGMLRLLGVDPYDLAERALVAELPERIGPARSYRVHIDRQGSDLGKGLLSRIDVTGTDVRTRDGLVIPRMDVRLEGVRFDIERRRLKSIDRGRFAASLDEKALTGYVRSHAGAAVKDVRVALRGGRLSVHAQPEVFGFGLPSEVTGRPVVRGDRVDFRADRVAFFGIGLPRIAVEGLENLVNPVADFSGLNEPARITRIAIRDDWMTVDGRLKFGRSIADQRIHFIRSGGQ
jgi:hypothetical protein